MEQHLRAQLKLWIKRILLTVIFTAGLLTQVGAQPEQRVDVSIRDFSFRTTQMPLQLHAATVIHVKNEDDVRHDFGSEIFHSTPTRTESHGVISYGDGIGGVLLDPGREVDIRFTIERPGRYQFQCSIHPHMKGEILLLSVGAV